MQISAIFHCFPSVFCNRLKKLSALVLDNDENNSDFERVFIGHYQMLHDSREVEAFLPVPKI